MLTCSLNVFLLQDVLAQVRLEDDAQATVIPHPPLVRGSVIGLGLIS